MTSYLSAGCWFFPARAARISGQLGFAVNVTKMSAFDGRPPVFLF
jgi:hypothetical protein